MLNQKLLIVLSILTLTLSSSILAQTPTELVESFFADYEEKGGSFALGKLYSTNKWMERNADQAASVKSQLDGLNEEFVGKYYGFEIIVRKDFTKSYSLLSCLAKFDRQPVRFIFHFYRPKDKWAIYAFKFDDNFGAEIEEAAKLYYLPLD
ncbi:MAG: hypothetical protein AAF388_09990 [Bacteroidota bacterium]